MVDNNDRKRSAAVVALVVVVCLAIGLGLASVILSQRADRQQLTELTEQLRDIEADTNRNVEEHRRFNQSDHNDGRADHACIIALALQLADPGRDRTVPVVPECRVETVPPGSTVPLPPPP